MDSLPLQLITFINQLRPLPRREVFDILGLLLRGILAGEVGYGAVRSANWKPRLAESAKAWFGEQC